MADQNIFFSKTINTNLLKLMDSKSESGKDKILVNFEDHRKVFLSLNEPHASVWGKMIDYLQKNNRPVYIEADPLTETITRVLAPEKDRVWRIKDDKRKASVDIAFMTSAVMYHLHRDMPNFGNVLMRLETALEKGEHVLITATDDFDIIDVRTLPSSFGPKAAARESTPDTVTEEIKPVSPERAKALFDFLLSCDCSPKLLPNLCIPFKVPKNGCWIRAHLMSYKLVAEGETPQKVWCSYSGKLLTAKTPNSIECQVSWIYHVAPILPVLQKNGKSIDMIFDPSMFDGPVPVAKWQKSMTVTKSSLNTTRWQQYERFGDGEASEGQANTDMEIFRNAYEGQCVDFGIPPYTYEPYNCPL
jgi:hypothetical protein